MMVEFTKTTLGDCISTIIDYRGKTPKKLGGDWANEGYRAFSAKNIKTGQIVNPESIRYIDENLYKSWMKDEIKRGDIIITSEAPFGEIYYWDSDEKIVLSQRLFAIRCAVGYYSKFIYYCMASPSFQSELKNRATGTTVFGLRQPELLKCELEVPDYPTQVKIASILSSLDNKIELNTRMNKVLEEIARALFHRWFVEFEFPNAEGKPYKSAGGKMVESEMGMVPEGWKVGKVGDIIELSYGKPLKEENRSGNGFPVFGSNGVVGWHNEWMVAGPGIIVGRKGNAGTVTWSHENFFPIDTTFYVVSKMNSGCVHYLYFLLQSLKLSHLSADSAVPGMNRNAALAQIILIPDIHTIIDFEILVSSLFSQMRLLKIENMNLIGMRDTLLPKLMNGEIDVSGISSALTLKTILSDNGGE